MHWIESITFDDFLATRGNTFWDAGNVGLASNQSPQREVDAHHANTEADLVGLHSRLLRHAHRRHTNRLNLMQ